MAKREPRVELKVERGCSGTWFFYFNGPGVGPRLAAWESFKNYATRSGARRAGKKALTALRRAKFVG